MIPPLSPCTGKQCFTSKAEALRVIDARRRRSTKRFQPHKEKKRGLATLHAYKCETCRQWHLAGRYTPPGVWK